jgi:uncharacterized protein
MVFVKTPGAFAFLAGAVIAGALALPGTSQAASFDCAKATTPTEHAICDNPQLSKLDDQTSGLYYTLISSGEPAAKVSAVKTAQEKFLSQRDACGANYNCLIDAYTSQIMFLKAEAGEGM